MLYLPPLASCIFNNMLQRNRSKQRYVSQEKVIFCNTNLWPSGCPCCKIAPAAQKLAAHPMWQRWAASHNSRCCIRHQPGKRGRGERLTLLVRALAPFKPTRLALAVQPVCLKRSLDVNASAHVHGRHPPPILSKGNMCAMCREASMASPLQAAASSQSCVRGGARPAC